MCVCVADIYLRACPIRVPEMIGSLFLSLPVSCVCLPSLVAAVTEKEQTPLLLPRDMRAEEWRKPAYVQWYDYWGNYRELVRL